MVMLSADMMCRRAVEFALQYYNTAYLMLLHDYMQTHGLQAILRSAEITLHKVSQTVVKQCTALAVALKAEYKSGRLGSIRQLTQATARRTSRYLVYD